MATFMIDYKDLVRFIKEHKTNNKCFCMRCSHIFDMLCEEGYPVRNYYTGAESLNKETMRKIWIEQFGKTFSRQSLEQHMKIKGDCGMIGWPEEDNNLIVEF